MLILTRKPNESIIINDDIKITVLSKIGAKNVQLWETKYFHEMPNHQAIFAWMKGTALRPILAAILLGLQDAKLLNGD